jgi:transcriptional regulator with XRE-family HTH domain
MNSQELKKARQDLGLTQEQAGKALGMKRQAYNLIENHRSPTKIHEAGVKMLVFIKKHGLLEEFLREG